jgi:uncharacterized protein
MSIAMDKASAPLFVRRLSNLQAQLDTAETDATARGYKAHVLLRSRLAPDMLRLLNPFQLASASATCAMACLSGGAPPSMPDPETTVAEIRSVWPGRSRMGAAVRHQSQRARMCATSLSRR